MAGADDLKILYISIPEDDIVKQTLFNVILTLIFFMIEKGIEIHKISLDGFIKQIETFKDAINTRPAPAKDATVKQRIQKMIDDFNIIDNKTRSERIERKIDTVIKYAEKKGVKLPSFDDFDRLLNGFDAKSGAAWLDSFKDEFTAWNPFANFAAAGQAAAAVALSPPPPHSRAAAAAAAPLRTVAPRQQPMSRVVGTVPFEDLSPDLQARCRTLEGLNAYIAGLYPGDRGSAPAGRQDVQAIVSTCHDQALLSFLREWRPKDSYGHLHDCLIESFLTATCPAFRVLKQDHKNTVAENFRQLFFASQREVTGHSDHIRLIDEIQDHRFLGNEHLSILSEIYRADFLILENRALGRAGATHFEINRSPRVYIIINPDNAHYEAVQPRPGNEDYSISREEAIRAVQCINAEAIREAEESKGISQRACLPTGSAVLYRGKRYVILEGKVILNRNTGEATCEGYYLSTHDMLAAFTALPNSFNEGGRRLYKESTAIKQRYLSFPSLIPAGEVTPANAAAGRRAANAAGMAAAGAPVRMAAAAVSEQQIAANAEAARRIAAEEKKKRENREAQEAANANFARRVAAGEFDGGSRRQQSIRRRTAKAPRRRRSLRARRRTPSKGKQHGSRRKR